MADRPDGTMPDTPIVGIDTSGTQRRILVDVDGRLALAGQDPTGQPYQIIVDASGRIYVQPVGLDPEAKAVAIQTDWQGRQFTRPSPVPTCNHSGWPVWWDFFEDGLDKWQYESGGVEAVPECSSESAFKSPLSAKLAVDDTADTWLALFRDFHLPRVQYVGLEYSVAFPTLEIQAVMVVQLRTGTNVYYAGAGFAGTTPPVPCILTTYPGWGWWNAENTVPGCGDALYHRVKLIIDVTNKEYYAMFVDDIEIDLSGMVLEVDTSTDEAAMRVMMMCYQRDAVAAGHCHFGHFILTDEAAYVRTREPFANGG